MSCRKTILELSNYLDGDLDPTLLAEINRHLAHCEDCRIIVDTTRKTVELYCNNEPLPLPLGVRERLDRALAAKLGHPK